MATNEPSFARAVWAELLHEEIEAAHQDYARAVTRQLIPGGEPIRLSRWKNFRGAAREGVRNARERVAKRIAPWLDSGY